MFSHKLYLGGGGMNDNNEHYVPNFLRSTSSKYINYPYYVPDEDKICELVVILIFTTKINFLTWNLIIRI